MPGWLQCGAGGVGFPSSRLLAPLGELLIQCGIYYITDYISCILVFNNNNNNNNNNNKDRLLTQDLEPEQFLEKLSLDVRIGFLRGGKLITVLFPLSPWCAIGYTITGCTINSS